MCNTEVARFGDQLATVTARDARERGECINGQYYRENEQKHQAR
jgi:hypothetical protein